MNEIENTSRTNSFFVPESAIKDEDGQPVELAAHMNPPIRANRLGISRNSVCPCGSGRKFKKCCLPRKE